jgi:multidrug efflux pump subunit AcrB
MREKVALVKSRFRPEVDEPRIFRFNPADLPSSHSRRVGDNLRDLTALAENVITPRIQNILGVGQETTMYSIIGFILLMGLVTKNAILLVDFINRT